MHLGALAFFTTTPGMPGGADVLELLTARAAAVPRLRMRVRGVWLPVGGAAWALDKDFNVHRHVRWLSLPEGEFAAEAARLAGELMERPLERGIPPWEMYVLTEWGPAGGTDGAGGSGPAVGAVRQASVGRRQDRRRPAGFRSR